jgi:hypothetical protein
MRLKEKLYRRFCAPEVRMLLDHMEENFQDFEEDYIDKKPWRRLMKSNTYTNVERTVIGMAYDRLMRKHERQQLLGKIIAQKLNPEPEKKSDDFMDTSRLANQYRQAVMTHQQYERQYGSQQNAGQQYQQDPRAMYGRTP